jgi:hypothetical protein
MNQELLYQLNNLYKNRNYTSTLEVDKTLCIKDSINERILKCLFSSYFLTLSKKEQN